MEIRIRLAHADMEQAFRVVGIVNFEYVKVSKKKLIHRSIESLPKLASAAHNIRLSIGMVQDHAWIDLVLIVPLFVHFVLILTSFGNRRPGQNYTLSHGLTSRNELLSKIWTHLVLGFDCHDIPFPFFSGGIL